eukprot:UN18471
MKTYFNYLFDVKPECFVEMKWELELILEQFFDVPDVVTHEIINFVGFCLLTLSFNTPYLGKLFQGWDNWEYR